MSEFESQLHEIVRRLQSDGMTVEIKSMLLAQIDGPCLASTAGNYSTSVQSYENMQTCSTPRRRLCKTRQCYNGLCPNDGRSKLFEQAINQRSHSWKGVEAFSSLMRILSHPTCSIVPQIQFDLDQIEVSNGFFFHNPTRAFIRNAIPLEKCGETSPRAFAPYDCETPPEPRYFKEGILNSFPDPVIRANFCYKFYQCPKGSGKTSWASIFYRIITLGKIASITPERQFSASMIDDKTQLVLQGGWMVTAMKHGLPRVVTNNSPFYIILFHSEQGIKFWRRQQKREA